MKKYLVPLVILLVVMDLAYFWMVSRRKQEPSSPPPVAAPISSPPAEKTTPPISTEKELIPENKPLPPSADHPNEFSFEAKRGESYVVEIILDGNWEDGDATLLVQGPKEKLLAQSLALARNMQSERFEILTTGTQLLRLAFENQPIPTYTINLKKVPTPNTFKPILKF